MIKRGRPPPPPPPPPHPRQPRQPLPFFLIYSGGDVRALVLLIRELLFDVVAFICQFPHSATNL